MFMLDHHINLAVKFGNIELILMNLKLVTSRKRQLEDFKVI